MGQLNLSRIMKNILKDGDEFILRENTKEESKEIDMLTQGWAV